MKLTNNVKLPNNKSLNDGVADFIYTAEMQTQKLTDINTRRIYGF